MEKFLVSYRLEDIFEEEGPIVAFVLAESEEAIKAAYPEVDVVRDWEAALAPGVADRLDVFDLHYRGPGLLRIVRHERGDYSP